MSRRTITAKLPIKNPDKFLTICESIVQRNNHLGPASPFADGDMVDMAEFANKVAQARAKREEALELHARAESLMGESRALLGINPGQSSLSNGTLYFDTAKMVKLLKVLNTENPEAISLWGLDVVVKTAKSRGKKKL